MAPMNAMSDDESTGAQEKNPTAPKAADGDTSSAAPVDFHIIDLEPIDKALERSRAPAQGPGLRRQPTVRVGKADDKSVSYDLAGDAIEIPSVFSTQNVTRSVRSDGSKSAGPSPASRKPSNDADEVASLNRKVLLLSLIVALLAVTNAITAYKLYSRSGQEPAGALAQTNGASDDWAKASPMVRPGAAPHPNAIGSVLPRPQPAAGGLGAVSAPPDAEPEPELPPAAELPVAAVQEWDAPRFAKAKIVQAQCALSGKLYMFRTPGCTSFVKFPAEALPAALAQAPGGTPDVFRINHAKGEDEPLLDCKMQGGAYVQVRLGKKIGPVEDLLRHSATILTVAKQGDQEILYVCALPNNACPSLLANLSAVPEALMVVPTAASGGRNSLVLLLHANPGSLVVKFRKSKSEAWSSIDPSTGLVIPRVGKVTFKVMGGSAGKWLTVSTAPDDEFSDLAKKCGPLPLAAADDKSASSEQKQMLQLLGIAQGYTIRIEDAAGRKLAAFRLKLSIPHANSTPD
jgi:hypothetical protein